MKINIISEKQNCRKTFIDLRDNNLRTSSPLSHLADRVVSRTTTKLRTLVILLVTNVHTLLVVWSRTACFCFICTCVGWFIWIRYL